MMRTVSLRRRVTAWGVAVVALVLAGLDVFVYLSLRDRSLNNLERLLERRAALAEELAPALSPEQLVARLEGSGVRVRNREPGGRDARSNADDTGIPEGTPPPGERSPQRELSRSVTLPTGEVVELYVSRSGVDETLRRLLLPAAVGTLAGILLAAILLARSARVALGPLDVVVDTARQIGSGRTGERLRPERTDTELGRMAAAFDEMLDALETALADARSAEQRSRRFLAEAAHQLRTPVAGIQASVEALPRARTRAEREQLLATMARESSRAGRRVTALLRMARLAQGDPPARRPTDLVSLCREEVGRAASLAPRLEVTFQASGPERPVPIDPDAVREALANLLDNARRHAVSRISVHLAGGRGGAVEVRVADDGPGLPENDREQPFEPFVSLDGHGGSGLGLAIARGITRAHGGDITYQEGAFTLRLPPAGEAGGDGGLIPVATHLTNERPGGTGSP